MRLKSESKTGKINCETPSWGNEIPLIHEFNNITIKVKRSLKRRLLFTGLCYPAFG